MFTDVTATPLYRTHKPDKWLDFIKCLLEGYSLFGYNDLMEWQQNTSTIIELFQFLEILKHRSDEASMLQNDSRKLFIFNK